MRLQRGVDNITAELAELREKKAEVRGRAH